MTIRAAWKKRSRRVAGNGARSPKPDDLFSQNYRIDESTNLYMIEVGLDQAILPERTEAAAF